MTIYGKEARGLYFVGWLIIASNGLRPDSSNHLIHARGIAFAIKNFVDSVERSTPGQGEVAERLIFARLGLDEVA